MNREWLEMEDVIFDINDPIASNTATQTTLTSSKNTNSHLDKFLNRAKFFAIKLPPIVLCEFFLNRSDYIYEEVNDRLGTLFFQYIIFTISKLYLIVCLFCCFLLFSLKPKYVFRIYEIVLLVLQPFLFTYLLEFCDKDYFRLSLFNSGQEFLLPKLIFAAIVHIFIAVNTILLYNDIYKNVICDKYLIYQTYLSSRNERIHTINDYLNSLSKDELKNLHKKSLNSTTSDENTCRKKNLLNKRTYFIVFYSSFAYMLNELNLFSSTFTKNPNEYFNIISLGYLLMLTFDLSISSDQLAMRLLVKIRILTQLFDEYGLNNMLGFNWFVRSRLPYLLRCYFGIKCLLFTINFIIYYDYYFNLNEKFKNDNSQETFSLFANIYELFIEMPPQSNLTTITEKIDVPSIAQVNKAAERFIWTDLNTNGNILNTIFLYLKMLLLNSTQTLVSIAALTSLISYQFRSIGLFINKIVTASSTTARQNRTINPVQRQNINGENAGMGAQQIVNNDNDFASVGDVSAILFFLLCVQSGISSLNGNHRVEKLLKNYSLLFIAILHYFHTSLDAQLMALIASSKPDWNSEKHLRLLGVCVSLIVIPAFILGTLLIKFSISTWLLAASAFSIELIVKMSVSLTIYAVFIFDSIRIANAQKKLFNMSKKNDDNLDANNNPINELADNTEDFIYYIKAFGHIVEFFIAIILFFNGAYILLFESYGAIRAIMMSIHAYFHIWCQARKGWSAYIKRRSAISKMKNLPIFNLETFTELTRKKLLAQHQHNEESLEKALNNIKSAYEEMKKESCAICFCELSAHEARITNCNHIFHFVCLRKWIYFQDTCPMCHQIVYKGFV